MSIEQNKRAARKSTGESVHAQRTLLLQLLESFGDRRLTHCYLHTR